MLGVCCVCKRIRYNGEWTDVKYVSGGSVTHTYCPPCAEEAMAEIAQASDEMDLEDGE